jgi:hypothetical protein
MPPDKTLDAWMVMEVPFDGPGKPWTRHLVGFRREGCKGQVSSSVEVFDPLSRRAKTRSGSIYELGERSRLNADALAVWGLWKHRLGIRDERDVTAEVESIIYSGGVIVPNAKPRARYIPIDESCVLYGRTQSQPTQCSLLSSAFP